MDVEAARRTRSIIMFLGPLLHRTTSFELPYAGGCDLGTRTVEPHMTALRPFGLEVKATDGNYHAERRPPASRRSAPIVLTERGDTVTENALLAAAPHDGMTDDPQRQPELHGPGPVLLPAASWACGSRASAPPRWSCTGVPEIDADVDYAPSRGPDRGDEPARPRRS